MSPQLENSPNDERRGGRPQTGGTPLATGPVAGIANRVYDAELATGFLAGVAGTVALAALGVFTPLLSLGTPAAAGTALLAPFVGLAAGVLAVPFGRARQRFTDGRRAG